MNVSNNKCRVRIFIPGARIEYIANSSSVWVDSSFVRFKDDTGKEHQVTNAPVIVDYDYEATKKVN